MLFLLLFLMHLFFHLQLKFDKFHQEVKVIMMQLHFYIKLTKMKKQKKKNLMKLLQLKNLQKKENRLLQKKMLGKYIIVQVEQQQDYLKTLAHLK